MDNVEKDPFADIQADTRRHRIQHGCEAYTFEDGPALIRIARKRRPGKILELGTALGYTACCLAHGSPQARVDTIEGDPAHVELAREHIGRHGLQSRITVHHGDFDNVLDHLAYGYDMAFFDGFAPAMETITRVRERLVPGGTLVCANLRLGSGADAQRLATELADASRWQRQGTIENGGTAILVKQPEGSPTA